MRSSRRTDDLSPSRFAVALAVLAALGGCDDAGSIEADAGIPSARVTPRFALAADPMDFGAIPFPDDLYLDGSGGIALGTLPSEGAAVPDTFPASIRDELHRLDGFSSVSPIFFYFDGGAIDPSSLPPGPAESLLDESGVSLWDVDPASPARFRRVPVLTHWNAELGQLALRPYDGHPLVPGRRYAAVITTALRDTEGMPIGPSPRFAMIRDAASRPSDPSDAEAWDEHSTILASLASNGLPRERVAGLAVFTVQRVLPDLRDARAIVWESEAPPVVLDVAIAAGPELDELLGTPEIDALGVDVPGGVAHQHIGWLVQGHFESPSFLSPMPGVHGRFTRNADGALEVRRRDDVPFTLTLPTGDLAHVPLVVFQHGLGGERSDMLAVADALAAAGWGVIAIDIPFHGLRALGNTVDIGHRFGDASGPDGFGDRRGMEIDLQYFGIIDDRGELPPFHPVYVRDVLRQSVVDLMAAVHVVREGDWSSVRAVDGLAELGFASDPLGFVGVSLGGIVGTVFVAVEQEIGAAVLNVTGGDLGRLVEGSATFSSVFFSLLLPRIGLDPEAIDPIAYPVTFHPELALYQTLLDAGDSMSFAPLMSDRSLDLLFQMAADDEVVPNRATEALARAAGAQIVDGDPVHTDLGRASAPASDNVDVSSMRVTRGLYRFAPATHGLLSQRMGEQRFVHPPEPPFEPVEPTPVENPVQAAVGQALHFLESWRSGAAEIVAPAR